MLAVFVEKNQKKIFNNSKPTLFKNEWKIVKVQKKTEKN